MRLTICTQKEQLNKIGTSIKLFAERYDTLVERITQLRTESKETTEKLTIDVAEKDEYARRINLEIQGVKLERSPSRRNQVFRFYKTTILGPLSLAAAYCPQGHKALTSFNNG
ncbi:hypothetical protein J6590_055633 [Homalodisca vitripennis]|nr:hypothetical protein J6590_055633 [Homalodisca vitripennis]